MWRPHHCDLCPRRMDPQARSYSYASPTRVTGLRSGRQKICTKDKFFLGIPGKTTSESNASISRVWDIYWIDELDPPDHRWIKLTFPYLLRPPRSSEIIDIFCGSRKNVMDNSCCNKRQKAPAQLESLINSTPRTMQRTTVRVYPMMMNIYQEI